MGEDTAREGGQATVGILLLDTKFPRVVGDGGNADTWPFPVLIEKVRLERVHIRWTRSSFISLAAADRVVRACAGAPDDRRAALRP